MRKRQRTDLQAHGAAPDQGPLSAGPVSDDAFINDHDAADSAGDDDDDDEKPKDKKAGRRKIKIEFIQDKSRRHITFSKRKAGIMKKAYELSTLTGTQVLLLVVSETGLVYTFTTSKLQPLVTQPEGKNLIQACLNAPQGTLPSSMPIGTPLGRSSNPMTMGGAPSAPSTNIPGGLSIGQGQAAASKDDDDAEEEEAVQGGRANSGDKRRRRASSRAANTAIPPPPTLSIPPGASGPPSAQPHPSSATGASPNQIQIGNTASSPQQQHSQVPTPNSQYPPQSYGHGGHQPPSQHPHQAPQHQQGDGSLYGAPHMMPGGGYNYPGGQGGQPPQQMGGLSSAAQQHGHWGPPQNAPQQQQQPQQVQTGRYGHR